MNTGCLLSTSQARAAVGPARLTSAGGGLWTSPGGTGLLAAAARASHGRTAFTAHADDDRAAIDTAACVAGHESIMRKLVIIVLIFVVIPIVWYRISFPTVSYRYRLSIAVESDGQVHSGSSVIEVGITFFPHWAAALSNGNQLHSTDRGQAVLIDLGARGVLVAALRGENYDYSTVDARELPGRAFFPSLVQRNASGIPATPANERAIAQMKGRVDLAMDNMPAFFWFSDPANPATAKLVKPENFASVIGDSTRLVSAQVEITYDPVAIDIDKKLPVYATLTAPPNNGLYTAPGGLVVGAGMFMSRGD